MHIFVFLNIYVKNLRLLLVLMLITNNTYCNWEFAFMSYFPLLYVVCLYIFVTVRNLSISLYLEFSQFEILLYALWTSWFYPFQRPRILMDNSWCYQVLSYYLYMTSEHTWFTLQEKKKILQRTTEDTKKTQRTKSLSIGFF